MESANVLWAIALAAGPLIGAVVGFALQLHSLRQAKAAFEKAQLEIADLKRRAELDADLREKLKLEIEDLKTRVAVGALTRERTEYEVASLRERAQSKSVLITQVTTDEVVQYAYPRAPSAAHATPPRYSPPAMSSPRASEPPGSPPLIRLVVLPAAALAVILIAYWLFAR